MNKILIVLALLIIPVISLAQDKPKPEYPSGIFGTPIVLHGDAGVAWYDKWLATDESLQLPAAVPAYTGNLDVSIPKYFGNIFLRSQLNIDMRHADRSRAASLGLYYGF